jgi:hypothetical protein
MPTFLREPIKKHRCPRCNADLSYERNLERREEQWICENFICRTVWVYRRSNKMGHTA